MGEAASRIETPHQRGAADLKRLPCAAARVALSALALALAGCAAPPITADVPRVVERVVIAPYAMHEACVRLSRGDRLDWRFESSAPLAFEIHYREEDAVLAPVVREASTGDSGTFEARDAREYCLTWEAGPPGAIIGYRVLLRRPVQQGAALNDPELTNAAVRYSSA